jgi:hypothetical protein
MKRAVESTEEFKAGIASITGDKSEHITGGRQPLPMLVRKKRVIRLKKQRLR